MKFRQLHEIPSQSPAGAPCEGAGREETQHPSSGRAGTAIPRAARKQRLCFQGEKDTKRERSRKKKGGKASAGWVPNGHFSTKQSLEELLKQEISEGGN